MRICGARDNHRSRRALLAEYTRFEVDLSTVDEVDATGIQPLRPAARETRQGDTAFRLHSPSAAVEKALRRLEVRARFDWIAPGRRSPAAHCAVPRGRGDAFRRRGRNPRCWSIARDGG